MFGPLVYVETQDIKTLDTVSSTFYVLARQTSLGKSFQETLGLDGISILDTVSCYDRQCTIKNQTCMSAARLDIVFWDGSDRKSSLRLST